MAIPARPGCTGTCAPLRAPAASRSAAVTPVYVRDYLDFLTRIVGDTKSGQWGFHVLSAHRAKRIFSRLRTMTLWLFSLTVLGVGARF